MRACRWEPSALITKILLPRPPIVARSKAIFLPFGEKTGVKPAGAEVVEMAPVGPHDLDPSISHAPARRRSACRSARHRELRAD